MHFGKRLLAFQTAQGLRLLNYKQLKKIIKSAQFDEFAPALVVEIETVAACINRHFDYLRLKAARLQVLLLQNRLLFTQQQVHDFRSYLKIPINVSDSILGAELVNVFESTKADQLEEGPAGYQEAIASFVYDLNEFALYLDINSCGFRKIVKKFTKRSDGMSVPSYNDFFDKAAFDSLRAFAEALSHFGVKHTVQIGEELALMY